MQAYIIRRLLLMIPTLIGITVVCFGLIQLVPGGPVEEYIQMVQSAAAQSGADPNRLLSQSEIENIRAYFGFDKPVHIRYWQWLTNILTGDFGESYVYRRPTLSVIIERMPISLFFGLTSFLISYSICIPLGMKKALRHGSKFDSISSLIIFAGYVIPGYALGILLILFFAGGSFFQFFPSGGIVSDYFELLPLPARIGDFLHHMILPMICYMASEFAFLTMLMKNSMLDETRKDYMRTALLKGMDFETAARRHALKNALLPIATRLSEIFTLMFAGALLIERVFDIDGMGLLVWTSIVSRDYNVVLAIIFLTSLLTMMGRLFSDILYTMIDPRIQLGGKS